MNEIMDGFDQARLLEIKSSLGVPDDDPIWVYLAGLDFYRRIFDELPNELSASREAELSQFSAQCEIESKNILAELKADLYSAAQDATKAQMTGIVDELQIAVSRLSADKPLVDQKVVVGQISIICICCFILGLLLGSVWS